MLILLHSPTHEKERSENSHKVWVAHQIVQYTRALDNSQDVEEYRRQYPDAMINAFLTASSTKELKPVSDHQVPVPGF